jgi:AcrR family transcriptional regulator
MEEKKLHIIKNVGKLYLKFGIRSVTMDDVAGEFGVSKKTLYQYFTDKQDLVSQVIDFFLENPFLDLKRHNKINAIDGMFEIRAHVAHIFKFYNNNIEFDLKKVYPQLYNKVHNAKRHRIFSNTVSNIKQGIAQGLYREDLNVEFIAKLQVGRMLFTLNPSYQIFEEHEALSLDLFDETMSYHMHAICTEKGLHYFKKKLNQMNNEEKN